MDVIKDGDWVILDENNEKRSFARIQTSRQVRIGKSTIPCDSLLGQPYGSIFELSADRKSASRLHRPPDMESSLKDLDTSKNNSKLLDENMRNQQMTKEDIEAMKAAGKGGDAIIEALISKSVTFQTKTEFSQEKYKKKKAKKYCAYVTVRQACGSSICQTLFSKDAQRISNLRPDTLAVMMSLGNVCAHQKVLVVETLSGVLTTSVVERLGGLGRVCALHTNKAAPLDSLQYANFSTAQRGVLLTAGLHDLLEARDKVSASTGNPSTAPNLTSVPTPASEKNGAAAKPADTACATPSHPESATCTTSAPGSTEPAQSATGTAANASAATEPMSEDGPTNVTTDLQATETATAAATTAATTAAAAAAAAGPEAESMAVSLVPEPELAGAAVLDGNGAVPKAVPKEADAAAASKNHKSYSATQEQLEDMARAGFNSAVLACPQVQPLALLDAVWPLLKPSTCFVIYSPWIQPLSDCMQQLHKRKTAVMLQLQESWMRRHQVLPGRTHPEMMTTGTGGYMLSGIKVVNAQEKMDNCRPRKEHQNPGARHNRHTTKKAGAEGSVHGKHGKDHEFKRPQVDSDATRSKHEREDGMERKEQGGEHAIEGGMRNGKHVEQKEVQGGDKEQQQLEGGITNEEHVSNVSSMMDVEVAEVHDATGKGTKRKIVEVVGVCEQDEAKRERKGSV